MSRTTDYEFTCHAPKFTDEMLGALRASPYDIKLTQINSSTIELSLKIEAGCYESMHLMFAEIASAVPDFTKITCCMYPCRWAYSEEPEDFVMFRGFAEATDVRNLKWYNTNCEFTVHGVELSDETVDAFHTSPSWFKVSTFGALIVLDVEVKGDRYSRMNELFSEIASLVPSFAKITCRITPAIHLAGKEHSTFQMNNGEEVVPVDLPVKVEVMRRVTPATAREE